MKTLKDLLNALPQFIINDNEESTTVEGGNIQFISQETGNVYDTQISVRNIDGIEHLIKNLAKYIPDNWADQFISFDRIRKMPDVKYWIGDYELFRNIIKYVSKEEFQQLICTMFSCFNLSEPNQVKNALDNNDENAFCNLMLKYQGNKRYQKFVAKCGLLLLFRRAFFLNLDDRNLQNEFSDTLKTLFEIKRNSKDTQIIDFKEFLENTKIDEQEKIDYLKNNYLYGIDILNYINFQNVEDEMQNHYGLKNKFDVVIENINSAAKDYLEIHNGNKSTNKSIERCQLVKSQLGYLYDKLLENGDITIETSKELFISVFAGEEIENDKQIVFKFKNQYSFKFLIQEMYKKKQKEINETPPNGIIVGEPSDIFFYYKCGSIKPLKFQKGNNSEYSDAARKEKKRISDIMDEVRQK